MHDFVDTLYVSISNNYAMCNVFISLFYSRVFDPCFKELPESHFSAFRLWINAYWMSKDIAHHFIYTQFWNTTSSIFNVCLYFQVGFEQLFYWKDTNVSVEYFMYTILLFIWSFNLTHNVLRVINSTSRYKALSCFPTPKYYILSFWK